MSDPSDPAVEELDALLDAERDIAPADRRAMARMATRLAAALPPGAFGPGGDTGGPPSGAGAGGEPATGATGASLASAGAGSVSWITSAKSLIALGAFVVGAAAGAAGHAALVSAPPASEASTRGPERSAPVDLAPAVPPVADAPVRVDVVPAPSASPSIAPRSPRPAESRGESVASAAAGGVDESLRSERALVERANAALARGDAEGALAAIEAHRERFPRGSLAEERDALAVRAHAARGDAASARAAAERFRKEHPDSLQPEPTP